MPVALPGVRPQNDVLRRGAAVTVLDRLVAAGICETRALAHLAGRRVLVDGVPVLDPHTPAERPARVVLLHPGPVLVG